MMNSQVHQLRAEGIGDDARMRLFFETAVGQGKKSTRYKLC